MNYFFSNYLWWILGNWLSFLIFVVIRKIVYLVDVNVSLKLESYNVKKELPNYRLSAISHGQDVEMIDI